MPNQKHMPEIEAEIKKNGIGLVFMLILVLTQVLSLNEFLELIVPICYLFCYLVAFYGPNALLIG